MPLWPLINIIIYFAVLKNTETIKKKINFLRFIYIILKSGIVEKSQVLVSIHKIVETKFSVRFGLRLKTGI